MLTVQDLMNSKGSETYSVAPDDKVIKALQLMSDKNVGAVLVVEKGQIVGIFSERDFARKILVQGKCSLDTELYNIMTHEMITVHPEQSLEECMALMTNHRIRHLPVMSKGRLVGMISIRDVVEVILSMKDSTIDDLRSYIFGEEFPR